MSELSRLELSGDDVVVARLSGEIDMSNANEVGDELSSAVPNTALGLVLDLTALTYLDSSGVHLVFDLAERLRRRQQQLRVVVPSGAPIRTLAASPLKCRRISSARPRETGFSSRAATA